MTGAASYRVETTGRDGEPVVVIDQLAPDADAARHLALAAPLAADPGNYPGSRAPISPAYCAMIGPAIARPICEVFGYRRDLSINRAMVSLAHAPGAHLDLQQRVPHIDHPDANRLAIVHFLCRRDFGGTAFFRHRSTGFERIGPDRHRTFLDRLRNDLARHGEPAPGYIAGSTPLFDQILNVPARYNRALLYRSSLLHCAAIADDAELPSDPALGRLTVASFLTAH